MKKTLCTMMVSLLGLALALPLLADTGKINYQARLLDSFGRRVTGTVDLSFKIYDAATDGNLLWSETQSDVTVQDGVYAVILGAQNPIAASVFSQNDIYLELGINGETLAPRQQITAAAYALVARTIMGSNIYENQTSGYVGVGTTNPVAKLDVNGTLKTAGFKMPTGATVNHVLVSDDDGNGTWEPISVVLTERDPIHTNWVQVVFIPATNSIWAAIAQRALITDVATATNDLWTAVGQRVLLSDYATATNNLWTAVGQRVLISTYATATNDLWTTANARVKRSGDVMTGPLTNNVGFFGNGAGLTNVPASGLILTNYVQKTGDTMTGPLTVSNNLTVALTNTAGDVVATNSFSLRGSVLTNWTDLTNSLSSFYLSSAAGVVASSNIASGAIIGTNLGAGAISNYNLGESAVTASKINAGAVTLGKIANNAVADSNIINAANWNNAIVCKQGVSPAGNDAIVYTSLYYLASGTAWSNANANASTTAAGMLGLALGASIANNGLLLNGQFSNLWSLTPGAIIYMDTNANAITTVRPAGTNNVVRVLGYVISSTNIYFNPDRTYIEILGE